MSSGSPSTQRSSRPIKLRASCDFCALSKVRCDRGQPQCLRCIKSGICCNYSESRRIGKAWQLCSSRSNSPVVQGTPLPKHQLISQPPLRRGTDHRDSRARSTSDSEKPRNYAYQQSDYSMPLGFFHSPPYAVPEITTPSVYTTAHNESHPNAEEAVVPVFLSHGSADMASSNLPRTAEAETSDMREGCPLNLPRSPSWDAMLHGPTMGIGDTGDCIKRATTALQLVNDPRTSCLRSETPSPSPMQALDATLDDSRTAMDTVREILDCPCAQSIQVALLLVLIVQQVMESYQTLLMQQHGAPPEQSPLANSLSAFDTPLAIGRYLLDHDLRSKIIIQVLWSEVEKIGQVLDTLAQYAQNMAHRSDELVLGTYISTLQASRKHVLQSLQQDKES
ncbi:hypothetical protein BDV23DRAFT_178533 [Aspergillus alliaceus]|uniref:Zn(2)-C6 fungal-type domain-containing protein n=1 Tax=Petromyces alliaceus TaxID=209559 RepID=A0A5N7CMK0_PETAA|nr:hypothetical protein BDV23DRAFT_178533 [Aspergillus alliaceus]